MKHNRMKGVIIMDGVAWLSGYDPATIPEARRLLEADFASGKRDRKDTRRHGKWLRAHADKLAKHHSQGGHIVGLSLEDGSPKHLSPPFGPSDNGGLMVAMDGFIFWKNKGGNTSGYYWVDVDEMQVDDKPVKFTEGLPENSQTPACYKGRMYVRGAWSVACLDFNR